MPSGRYKHGADVGQRKFTEAQIREAFTVAWMKGSKGRPAWTAAARAVDAMVGTKRSKRQGNLVLAWSKRHPQIFAEVKAQVEAEMKKVAPTIVDLLLENALLAAQRINSQLKTQKAKVKYFELNGILDYAIKNAQLLQNKATGNLNITDDIKVEIIHKISEARAEMNRKNRIAGYLGTDG